MESYSSNTGRNNLQTNNGVYVATRKWISGKSSEIIQNVEASNVFIDSFY